MSVNLRIKGWITQGATVPVSPEAMADLVQECRRLTEAQERSDRHSNALRALVLAIKEHGTNGEEFTDAYRAAVAALA